MLIIGQKPFDEGVPCTHSMTVIHFFYNRAHIKTCPSVHTTKGLYYRKNQLKVFGKGYGGEPFLRKVSPIINYKFLYKCHGYTRVLFFFGYFYFANYRHRIDALFCIVVGKSCADSLLREHRAVNLYCGKSVQSLNNSLICKLQCVVN